LFRASSGTPSYLKPGNSRRKPLPLRFGAGAPLPTEIRGGGNEAPHARARGHCRISGALAGTTTAGAQNQSGLVNVAIVDNTVHGVAANVCGVTVNLLASNILNGDTTCSAVSDATATFAGGGGGGGGGNQQGLINLYVANNTVQVPAGIAANVCGVAANVLAANIRNGDASCDALGNATAGA
jgi:hypothetical protein